jgi:PAS domain S-box-containing protein
LPPDGGALGRFIDSLPALVFATDGTGRLVAWNGECRRVTGYSLGELERSGWSRLFPDRRARTKWARELASRERRRFRDWEWEVSTRSGERRVLSWTSGPGRPPVDGGSRWAIGRDVTDCRRTADALRDARDELHVAQSTAAFGMWDMDLVTRRIHWTPELARIYGVSPRDFGGTFQDFLDFIHPDDRAGFLRRFRKLSAAGKLDSEDEFRIVRPDGRERWIHTKSVVIRAADGSARRLVGINIDFTESRQTAQALKQNEEYLQVALKSSRLIIFHQDRQLRFTWIANPALGFTDKDVIGRTPGEIRFQGWEESSRTKRRIMRTGRGERRQVWLSHDGRRSCFDQIMEPQRDDSGRITGVVTAAYDITERVNALQDLKEAQRQLQMLASHIRDTVEEERRAVAQDVHDQVGSVLTGMRMRLAQLAEKLPCGDPTCRDEILSVAAMAEQAMVSTREICARLRPPALEDLGLVETCRWYLRDWSRTTGVHARGRFERLVPEPSPEMGIDVFRILQELLTNVARHAGARHVRVRLGDRRGGIRLVVSDDGHGFTASPSRHGFGIAGLRERAARHGGQMEIETGPEGTTVTVTLPRRART